MTDYISRDVAKAFFTPPKGVTFLTPISVTVETLLSTIDNIPAADVRPVRRGKWENNHCSACGMMPMGEEIWECCDFTPPKFEWFMNFCPNCGADMREAPHD